MQVTGLSGRRFKDFDHDLVFPDGRVVTLVANTAPLLDEHGAVRGVVGAYMDSSERKRAEEKRRSAIQPVLPPPRRPLASPSARIAARWNLRTTPLA
jgi:hypothetical protein